MFKSILFLLLLSKTTPQDISPIVDVKILSELPLNRLLQVRNTFDAPIEDSVEKSDSQPQALALQGKLEATERGGGGGHYEESSSKKGGKKGVQSIFQLSVTTLAFLAFGGYLLCLLVQAVKAKDTAANMMAMDAQSMAALLNSVNKRRRRPTRRRKRPIRKPIRNKYTKPARPKREILHDIDPEQMYFVLLNLSEAYTDYHTIDYRRFNYTKSHYFN